MHAVLQCNRSQEMASQRSEEEKCELEDEEGEQLHFLMEPILKELKDCKRPWQPVGLA